MMPTCRKTIIDRTMDNLKFVKSHAAPDGPFEVTQLVNSFLMTLLQNWDDLNSEWPHFKKAGIEWPKFKMSDNSMQPSQCVVKIRDALAHGCFVFEDNGSGEIGSMHLWTCPNKKEVDWHATLTVKEMEKMLECIVQLASTQSFPKRSARHKGDTC